MTGPPGWPTPPGRPLQPSGAPFRPASPPFGPESWLGGRLFGRRVVMMSGELDDTLAGHVVAQLMTLDAEGDESIELYIDSYGDDVGAALSVMDVIDLLGVEVEATGLGRVEGATVGVLAICARRRVAPNARIRLKEPRFDLHGSARDLAAWHRHSEAQAGSFRARVAEACGREAAVVAEDMSTGLFLGAAEAVAYGLADSVADRVPGQLRVVTGSEESSPSRRSSTTAGTGSGSENSPSSA